tara:strand:+ start:616 stop:861 length:246 start_codon:yes stop_codon:yes gene_type:complete
MPRYIYRCDSCKAQFQEFHLISETLTICRFCDAENCLVRIPQLVGSIKKTNNAGNIVNTFIEDTRREVKEEKEKLIEEFKS